MKNYPAWTKLKIIIENQNPAKYYFNEREVWWCSIGLNVGEEEDGKNDLYERPVIILKKFNPKICLILPLTSKDRRGKFYFTIALNGKVQTALLSQVKLISIKRLLRRIGKMGTQEFYSLKKSLCTMILS